MQQHTTKQTLSRDAVCCFCTVGGGSRKGFNINFANHTHTLLHHSQTHTQVSMYRDEMLASIQLCYRTSTKNPKAFFNFSFFSPTEANIKLYSEIISWKNGMKIFIFLFSIRAWHQDTGKENFSNISSPLLALLIVFAFTLLAACFLFGRFLLLNVTFHSLAVPTTIPIIPASHTIIHTQYTKKD